MIEHIVGPPGTGKTETLMARVEEHLAKGVHPENIGYISFTRAAVNEARRRAAQKFKLSRDSLPNFGTLHSLCFRALGLTRKDIFTPKHWKEVAEHLNLRYSEDPDGGEVDEFEPFEIPGTQEGDVLRAWYDWARNCELPLEEASRRFDPPLYVQWTPSRALWFAREFEDYKQEKGLLDFTDLLLEIKAKKWRPRITALVLDEAQDLSPLQRSVFLLWAESASHVHLGYDEDQAVYGFQGAEPTWLLNHPGERLFLTQSFRVPASPARLAHRLISRNKNRYGKHWEPRAEEGLVKFDVHLEQLVSTMLDSQESWYLLGRNNHHLSMYTEFLQKEAIPYTHLRGFSPLSKVPGGIVAALRLASGLRASLPEIRLLADQTAAKPYWQHGAKTEIRRMAQEYPDDSLALQELQERTGATDVLVQALGSLETCLDPLKKSQAHKAYYGRLVQRLGIGVLNERPKVVIGSIHSVKGGQADNVVLISDMTRRTFEGYEDDPEPERRVWYVGATRCIKRLFVLEPRQRHFFDEW